MRLQITHDTHYRYPEAVHTAQHMAHLSPPSTATQTVAHHDLQITPEPETGSWTTRTDAFGNRVVQWQTVGAHPELLVRALSTVTTHTLAGPRPEDRSWQDAALHYRYTQGQAQDPATLFSFASTHVPKAAAFANYAAASFDAGTPLVDAALDLLRRMNQDFSYQSLSTTIHTPALAALQARQGVCQDFAHIMLACLRSKGLAARYISGYLLTQPPAGQPRLRGSDASHAWVALHVPLAADARGAWLHLDPTNHRSGWGSPGQDYVELASGRDFADVSPLRGVLQGGAAQELRVAVTVEPVDDTHPSDAGSGPA